MTFRLSVSYSPWYLSSIPQGWHWHDWWFCLIVANNVVTVNTGAIYSTLPKQTRNAHPVLVYCWASVCDAGPTINQHWMNDGYHSVIDRGQCTAIWLRIAELIYQTHLLNLYVYWRLNLPRVLWHDCHPSKNKTLTQCWFNAGRTSQTVRRH